MTKGKAKVAIYGAGSCGGCDMAVLDIHGRIFKLVESIDIVFWPTALDIKRADLEAMPDGSIDVCLFNGSICNSEEAEMAELLRDRSKVLVAFGACSHLGGVPGLLNSTPEEETIRTLYTDNATTPNRKRIVPKATTETDNGDIELPELYYEAWPLSSMVDVDCSVPGCPPVSDTTWKALTSLLEGSMPEGGVFGSDQSVCEECGMERRETGMSELRRIIDGPIEGSTCLLDQGVICMGPSTRGGCGAECTRVGMPCSGCYGPSQAVSDQGASMMSAIASIVDEDKVDEVLESLRDPIGIFYKYSLPSSILIEVLRRERDGDDADE